MKLFVKFLYAFEVVSIAFLTARGILLPLAAWLLFLFALQMWFNWGSQSIFLQTQDTYPDKNRIAPGKLSFLFQRWHKIGDKGLPKEIYIGSWLKLYSFAAYTLLLPATWLYSAHAGSMTGIVFLSILFVILFIEAFTVTSKRLR